MLSEACVMTMKSEEKRLMMLKLGVRELLTSAPTFISGAAGWQPCHPCPKAAEMGQGTHLYIPAFAGLPATPSLGTFFVRQRST